MVRVLKSARQVFYVAPNGGTWVNRQAGIYKTSRGNMVQLSKEELRREKRLTLSERLRRVELWISHATIRDAAQRLDILESCVSMKGA
jgi:hypothetical protein